MGVHPQRAAVITIEPPVRSSEIPVLCRRVRTALADESVGVVACDIGALTHCDVTIVDVLVRMQLTARLLGRSICLLHASPEFVETLAATGLADVLPVSRDEQ